MTESAEHDFAVQVIVALRRILATPGPLHEVVVEPVAAWSEGAWIYFVYRTERSPLTFGLAKDTGRPDKLTPWRAAADAALWYLSDLYGVPHELIEGDPSSICWIPMRDGLPSTVDAVDEKLLVEGRG